MAEQAARDALFAFADYLDRLAENVDGAGDIGAGLELAANMARQRARGEAEPLPDVEPPVSERGEAEAGRTAYSGPRRGDDTEAWLKRYRDGHSRLGLAWQALDDALDDYRLHTDTGTPLTQDVPEPGEQP